MDDDRRVLEHQFRDAQLAAARTAFPLSVPQLASLFEEVAGHVAASGCDHSHRFTLSWLARHQLESAPVVEWLEENGGFCDCEVNANARDRFEQARAAPRSW